MTDIGGGQYIVKRANGLTSLKISKISKKAQQKQDKIQKKLYEANKWWNYLKFQLYWNKLEWLDPKTLIRRDKPYSVSSKIFYLNKNDRTDQWVGHSQLKELDNIDFFERKRFLRKWRLN